MSMAFFWHLGKFALTTSGVAVLALAALLAVPLKRPPPLDAIEQGALKVSQADRPAASTFRARDGSELSYRLYPAKSGAATTLAILIHGSSGSSAAMNAIGVALADNGVAAVAVDIRGHGASGPKGDIAYIGQLDDDLADLVDHLRRTFPEARLVLVGHSSGGGFVLRIAGEPLGKAFSKFVLLAPYLGYRAPTNRPPKGDARWTSVDIPRIIALSILQRFGITWFQSLPVIAFATDPDAAKYVTPVYSYRLLTNFGPPDDWHHAFMAAPAPVDVFVGAQDELMKASTFVKVLASLAPHVRVTVFPGVDHMGMLYDKSVLASVVKAVEPAATKQP